MNLPLIYNGAPIEKDQLSQDCAYGPCREQVIPDDVYETGNMVEGLGFCCKTHVLACVDDEKVSA